MSFSVVSSLTFRTKEGRAGKRSESNEQMPALFPSADEFTNCPATWVGPVGDVEKRSVYRLVQNQVFITGNQQFSPTVLSYCAKSSRKKHMQFRFPGPGH